MKSKIIALGCALFFMTEALAADPPQFRALMITTTDGWHHEVIADAVPAIRGLAAKHQFEVVWEENIDRMFTAENLEQYDVIIFLLTTGDILNTEQQVLMQEFMRSGKGFVGVHSAIVEAHDPRKQGIINIRRRPNSRSTGHC